MANTSDSGNRIAAILLVVLVIFPLVFLIHIGISMLFAWLIDPHVGVAWFWIVGFVGLAAIAGMESTGEAE